MTTFRTRAFAIKCAENKAPEKIQLFRTGTFHHAEYGTFQITKEVLASMVKNFTDNVRGVDLAIDYKHENDDVAAGWIRGLELADGGDSLWATVEWTPKGSKVLADKEFRYMSPEFAFEYQDNETLKKFGPTLFGGGLTNRPTIKNMEPVVELTEGAKLDELDVCARDLIPDLIKEGKPQDQAVAIAYSKCRAKLGIGAAEPKQQPKGVGAMDYKAMDPAAVDGMGPDELKKMCKEMLAEIKKAGEVAAQAAAEKAMSEKKAKFAVMLSEGKVVKAQEESFLAGDMETFASLAPTKKLNEGEQGSGVTPPAPVVTDTAEQAQDEILKQASKMLSEKKIGSMGEAIKAALQANPELKQKIYG